MDEGEPLVYQHKDLENFYQFQALRSPRLAIMYGEQAIPKHNLDLLSRDEEEGALRYDIAVVSQSTRELKISNV